MPPKAAPGDAVREDGLELHGVYSCGRGDDPSALAYSPHPTHLLSTPPRAHRRDRPPVADGRA